MAVQREPYLSPQEYLEGERLAPEKSEYINGQVYAMAGASREHNLITTNLVRSIGNRLLGRPCETYSSDMRVKVSETGMYTYPDIAVVCGDVLLEDQYADTLLNPVVIIEVLSPSTESHDRGAKFAHYRHLESLQEYVLVAQDRMQVEHYVRQPGSRWMFTELTATDGALRLESLEIEIPLSEIYDRIEFTDSGLGPGLI